MISVIARLTFRQVLGKRRTVLLGLLSLLPVLLGVLYLFASDPGYTVAGSSRNPVFVPEDLEWVAKALMAEIVLGTLLPLAALIFGTAVLGSEVDDGTAVYLLSKPVSRLQVLLAKVFVAWVTTLLFVVPPAAIAAAVALVAEPGGDPAMLSGPVEGGAVQLVAAFVVAMVAGGLVYSALFVFLSLMTSRAFIAGLIYVFLWEGVVTRLFSGTRIFSVRKYSRGIAELFAGVDAEVFDAQLAGYAAISLMVVTVALAMWLALRKLQRFEIGETT